MELYYYFYGNQLMEFERPRIPKIINEKGVIGKIKEEENKVKLSPSLNKVVVLNVCD